MDEEAFVATYGAIYEDSPWVARQAWQSCQADKPVETVSLASLLQQAVDTAGPAKQLELIRSHPDLAGRAALAGAVTDDSRDEQASAGLDQCTAGELKEFSDLNHRYRKQFDFPFIMAVRGADRRQILSGFRERLSNSYEVEFARALTEIHKIARLRLEAMHGEC